MNVIKNIQKAEMTEAMKQEAKKAYASCSDDCPRCRVSDG